MKEYLNEHIIIIIILGLTTLLLIESVILRYMMKSKRVYISDNRLAGGMIFTVLTYALVYFLWDRDGVIWPVLFTSGLGFLNLFIYNFPRVSYDDHEINVLSFPYRRRRFTYTDITGLKWGKNGDYKLYFGHFKLYVDETAIGGTEFLRSVFEIREEQFHQRIPEITEKLFHGYFVNPKELLIAYMLVPLFTTGCFAALLLSDKTGNILWGLGILATVCWIGFFIICYILNHAPRYRKIVKLLVRKENWRFY